eukprot:4674742-Pyramimonas_sp.AAC.2
METDLRPSKSASGTSGARRISNGFPRISRFNKFSRALLRRGLCRRPPLTSVDPHILNAGIPFAI